MSTTPKPKRKSPPPKTPGKKGKAPTSPSPFPLGGTGGGSASPWQLRSNNGQGIYTRYFQSFIPRKVEADFYEFLREAIPVIDAAIGRLTSLDGHIIVKGENESLVEEIQEWLYNVPVNDIQKGMQAFHQSLSNEAFEQGFGLGEYVVNKKRNDIVGLRVGDSKYIKFKRKSGTGGIEIHQKSDEDTEYRLLNSEPLMYFSIANENQNPYGTPLMRSCEFVAKVLVTIQNAIGNTWERFGDPCFSIVYKSSRKDSGTLGARKDAIQAEFTEAIKSKREGKSADFIKAIDKDSDIRIKIIGADGQVLDAEVPSRHMLEQIIAKTGLPAWMLGMHWSTTERLSNAEAEMLLADVSTRQAAKMPLFYNLVRTLLTLRGRTWKKGDWWLEWGNVNLHDLVQQAQARFLNAQADWYYLTTVQSAGIEIDINDLAIGKSMSPSGGGKGGGKIPLNKGGQRGLSPQHKTGACGCGHSHIPTDGTKELNRPVPWPALDKIETDYENQLKSDWNTLLEKILKTLGSGIKLPGEKGIEKGKAPPGISGEEAFTFSEQQRASIMQHLKDFLGVYDFRSDNSAVKWYYGQSYSLGLIQAANLLGKERPILDIIKNEEIFTELVRDGFNLVKNNATNFIANQIMAEMESFVIVGAGPGNVATHLRKRFGDKNSDWERLARTEMSMAAEKAKRDEWEEWEVKTVEFTPAPDACPICMALAGDYPIAKVPIAGKDTHPRCRCAIRPAKSEFVA